MITLLCRGDTAAELPEDVKAAMATPGVLDCHRAVRALFGPNGKYKVPKELVALRTATWTVYMTANQDFAPTDKRHLPNETEYSGVNTAVVTSFHTFEVDSNNAHKVGVRS